MAFFLQRKIRLIQRQIQVVYWNLKNNNNNFHTRYFQREYPSHVQREIYGCWGSNRGIASLNKPTKRRLSRETNSTLRKRERERLSERNRESTERKKEKEILSSLWRDRPSCDYIDKRELRKRWLWAFKKKKIGFGGMWWPHTTNYLTILLQRVADVLN